MRDVLTAALRWFTIVEAQPARPQHERTEAENKLREAVRAWRARG
jgi:hypothetical protein